MIGSGLIMIIRDEARNDKSAYKIAKENGISKNTVKKYLNNKELPGRTHKRSSLLDPFKPKINRMMADGLVEEVKRLREAGCSRNMVSMQGLGYKEILDALDGITSLEEAVRILKRDTRHFAKRQLTWFRREDAIWIDMDAEDPLAEVLKNISCRNTPHVV